MPSSPLRLRLDGNPSHRTLAALLLASSVLSYLLTPIEHSLLTDAVAWLVICTYTTLKTRRPTFLGPGPAQRLSWAAGAVLALAQLYPNLARGNAIWWANGLLPIVTYFFLRSDIITIDSGLASPPPSPGRTRMLVQHRSKTALIILSSSAVLATWMTAGRKETLVLGLSYTALQALAFLLIEKAKAEAQSGRQNGGSVIYSANGLLSQPAKSASYMADAPLVVMRDVSTITAAVTSIVAVTLEDFGSGWLPNSGVIGFALGRDWLLWHGVSGIFVAVLVVGIHVIMFWALMMMIQTEGALLTSFIPLSAAILSRLAIDFCLSALWFAGLCAVSMLGFFETSESPSGDFTLRMRFQRTLTLAAVVSFAVQAVIHLRQPVGRARLALPQQKGFSDVLKPLPPVEPLSPMVFENTQEHPITQLIRDADATWQQLVDGQSQTLEAAVAEYQRRYRIPPPPHFDKWYEFAKRKNVQIIDEYDTVYKTMLPFWGLSPATIRARAREAIGYKDNMLMGLALRDGETGVVKGGEEWLQQAAAGMMKDFVQYLPDMDLVFNIHDEPRVVVPHDDLSRLVRIALDEQIPAVLRHDSLKNAFSPRPNDLNNGKSFDECKTTRFNWYAHQPVWDPSRLSCAPDTPSRALDESSAADNLTAYAISELGFVYNQTAFNDICNSPSLSSTFGFFDRPNAFNTVHDLFPIFSQSKISSFNDILYPSPWYWYGKVKYEEDKDNLDWKQKTPSLLWRGSTTGGFSRNGGWKRQHRQHMVEKLNAHDNAKIYREIEADSDPRYQVKEVPREDYKDIMDVHFSHIGQCDQKDCDAQRDFFGVSKGVPQQDHWKWRYLLDMDGNAFSGRFYAFLKSKSLVFKMAIFREWHQEWLKPWVHFVPLSLRGDDVLESVRFFSSRGEGGEELGMKLAEQGRDWAHKVLRNEDFEVWFFRLLLEYGRVIDDNRAEIGYTES